MSHVLVVSLLLFIFSSVTRDDYFIFKPGERLIRNKGIVN